MSRIFNLPNLFAAVVFTAALSLNGISSASDKDQPCPVINPCFNCSIEIVPIEIQVPYRLGYTPNGPIQVQYRVKFSIDRTMDIPENIWTKVYC